MLTREIVGRTFGQNWHHVDLVVERSPFFWHYHPEFELTLTRNGRGTRYIAGDVAAFGELDLALVGAGQAHTWNTQAWPDGRPQHIQVIFFTRAWLASLAGEALPELTGFLAWLDGIDHGASFSPACIADLLPAFDRLRHSRDLARLSSLLEIFDALPRDKTVRYLGGHGQVPGSDRRLDAALAFMQANFRQPIRLSDIAAAASTSEATLKRLFRQRLNLNATELLIQLRVGQACDLLMSSDVPIEMLAEQSGFPNPSHFYRQFRRLRMLSPAQFRKRHHLRQAAAEGLPPTEGFRARDGLSLQAPDYLSRP
ncbi:MAG: helix-turn-helix domain-containing protein [Uliginosibacterium sp.]|nr:helix-turn-helix domain-containing protein [Uliginosibacterium sp.]